MVSFLIGGNIYCSEAVVQKYSVKKVFLKISQNSQENTCARVSFCVLDKSPEALRKLFLSTKFSRQKIWWNYGIFGSNGNRKRKFYQSV